MHHTLDRTQTVPTAVNATLTFNSTAGTTWYYNTSHVHPRRRPADRAPGQRDQPEHRPVRLLGAGRRRAVDQHDNDLYRHGDGAQPVDQRVRRRLDAPGPGADHRLGTGGVILSLGENGESLWFAGSPGVGGNYTSPAGDFSTLTKTTSGYTRTLTDGTQITFNSSGYETATIDLNGLHTTYSYNGSNQLTSIEDPYGNFTTLHLQLGQPEHDPGPGRRLTTFTFSGGNLAGRAAGRWLACDLHLRWLGPHDAGAGPASQRHDHRYDSAERVGTITRPDGTTQLFSSYQEQGWTNSGTSGSPAAATLLAEAATNYTDPNGNSSQIRPDWMGLGQLSESDRPVRQRHRPTTSTPTACPTSRSTGSTGSPSTTTTPRATR